MAAYKDKNRSSWYVKFYFTDYQGAKKMKMKRGFLTKKEALGWEREFLLQQHADLDMKFEKFIEIYRKDKALRIKSSTWDSKGRVIDQKLLPWFGEMPMNQIKSSDILKWQNEMISQGLSPSYLRMIQNQLTAVFNHAERYYELNKNPCKKVDKMGSAKPTELNFWTLDEFQLFIKCMLFIFISIYHMLTIVSSYTSDLSFCFMAHRLDFCDFTCSLYVDILWLVPFDYMAY